MDNLFDQPSAPTRPSRFVPKCSRLKPHPKTESSSSTSLPVEPKPQPSSVTIDEEIVVVKKEETDDFMEAEEKGLVPVVEAKDEDVVVREIDVYFNPIVDPDTKLYVLQYPLRPLWRPYELYDSCEEVRVKPDGGELEIDLAIDVDSRNYNSSDETKQMGKQTLSTKWKPSIKVGILQQ